MRKVGHVLGWLLLVLAGSMAVSLIAAVVNGEVGWSGHGIALVITAFVGAAMVMSFSGQRAALGRLETMGLIVVAWLGLPLAASLPFVLAGGFGGIDAYLQATSALTTSGARFGPLITSWPASLTLYCGLLQWLGGALTLAIVIALVVPMALVPVPGNTAFGIAEQPNADPTLALWHGLVAFVPTYCGATLLCFACLALGGLPVLDAAVIALGTISTGGIIPNGGPFAAYASPAAEWVMIVAMAFAAGSIFWLRYAATRRLRDHAIRAELVMLAAILTLTFAAIEAARLIGGANDAAGVVDQVRHALFAATSLVSTTGTPIVADIYATVPIGIIVTVAMIGGASASPTGGLKLNRSAALAGRALQELWTALYPRGIQPLKLGAGSVTPVLMRSLFALGMVHIAAVAGLLLVVAPAAADFEQAFRASIGAISNVLQITDVAGEGAMPIASWPTYAKLALGLGMAIGRIEAMILLALVYGLIWRR